jgi:hypothetical protein
MAATITREQLNKLLEGIATSHWQVHTYGWGDVPDLLAREDVIYPFMMVTPQASVYGDNTINHTYTISIADRVLKDKENEVAVDSDTHQILMDVVTQLDNLLYDDVDLIKGITVTPFFDNFRHEVTGHFANVTVQVMYNYDACAIPSDNVVLPLPPPSDCADASYRVQYENGTLIEEGTIPSGGSKTIDVPNIIPCADATWELRDSAGVLIDSGSIASGGSATITAPDGVVTITDSAAATLYVVNVKSDGTATQVIADSVVTLNNSAAGLISTTNVKAEDAATIVAPDGNITVNSVAFSTVESGGTENVQVRKSSGSDLVGSKQGTNWRIGDSTVNVNKSDGVLISARVVRAEETDSYNVADSVIENSDSSYTANVKATDGLVLPDQQIDVNSVNEGSIPSVGGIDINITDGVNQVTPNSVGIVGRTVTVEVPSGGGSPSGVAFQFPTPSQYTSYANFDEGWRVQNGWYDYTPPTQPAAIAELDYTSANQWYLLKNNLIVNGVSSKTRFVDLNGVQTWGATNNVNAAFIDKLTGLMCTRLVGGFQWPGSITNAEAYSITINGVTYNDWYLMSMAEACAVFGTFFTRDWTDPISTSVIHPAIGGGNQNSYLGTTVPNATTSAVLISGTADGSTFFNFGKNSGGSSISFYVRKAFSLITAP